ncbi:DUF2141 domain-containing protein [Sphingopyxis sp.]|uniref:DUF2141 domain-containing protein n=1 Tax=Sphingopyxis sp. TaxID=1908224 RepID=UPI0025CDB9D8|nr:DUF2141 domain-containing protein [Sphingopyxis sp.]
MSLRSAFIGASGAIFIASPASAGEKIPNDMARCSGDGATVLATVRGIKQVQGTMRVQSYRATKADWLKKGRWLKRIDVQAAAGTMRFCIPVDAPGRYAIAVRHDLNGNGKTDIFTDGGGMSNNPSISVWNLGKPSYKKVAFAVDGRTAIRIDMKYM